MKYADDSDAKNLNAEQWQLDLLQYNPSYLGWGPHEDYMLDEGTGWTSRKILDSWGAFGPWGLNELNECVNFYFDVSRASKTCECCNGDGYHKAAREVVDGFYNFNGSRHDAWCHQITADEHAALGSRTWGLTLDETNAANAPGRRFAGHMRHDGINRGILIEARCKRLGLPLLCDVCGGDGSVYTEPAAKVAIVLWWLHPRKGCSRGIEVNNIQQSELPAVFAFLREAAQRNANRFSKVPA